MKTVIMAQTNQGFQEFFLPGIHNADYQIRLEREIFGLLEDLVLKLEILDETWRIVENDAYSITGGRIPEDYMLQEGDIFTIYPSQGGQRISLLVVIWNTDRISCEKYDISGLSEVSIGSTLGNQICYQFESFISKRHALILRTQKGWCLYDYSRNGVFLNGSRVREKQMLTFGDCITLFGLRIVFLEDVLACSAAGGEFQIGESGFTSLKLPKVNVDPQRKQKKREKKYYKSAPRTVEPLFDGEIEIENPPARKQMKKKPLFLTIGPAFTMAIPMILGCSVSVLAAKSRGGTSGVYMYTGMITAVSSAVFGVVWAFNNLKYVKKEEEEEEELRYNAYGQYLIDMAQKIREKYENNIRILNATYLSGEECCHITTASGSLWNRNSSQKDFLWIRLGRGDLPFSGTVNVPKQRFALLKDDLMEKPAQMKKNFATMYQVPVCLDLKQQFLIGVIGGMKRTGGYQIMENIVAQIAANNCYTDVRMIFVYDGEKNRQKDRWEFVKWLPHVWSEDKKVRYVAENKTDLGDVCYALGSILREREEEDTFQGAKNLCPKPHFVLFLADPEMLEGELIYRYVTQPSSKYGITTFWLAQRYEDLPNSCEEIICNDGQLTGLYNVNEGMARLKRIAFDHVDHRLLAIQARSLAGIEVEHAQKGGGIPNQLDFLTMYGVNTLKELQAAQRWKKNRVYESMRVPVGLKAGGQECCLDIHEKYHGPHGLVAGTTGSGKSETLQTYILSLAVNFSPDDVCFFIIDFKGGGMANLFTNLPHMAGQISNLSGNQVKRAMVSIKSENRRRQRIFNEQGVNNINSYTRLYQDGEAAVPIPHLLIVIDEFAELKREEPEFMKELISVAQVGRSLGVHLILATQKPDGTVDDNIWSNTKFRLCLRVQDKKDSAGMLHRPDAAYITQAGRCYLQVGNDEIFELFQSGYSGAIYDRMNENTQTAAEMLTLSGRKVLTGSRMKREYKERMRREWFLALAQVLTQKALEYHVEMDRLFEMTGDDEDRLQSIFQNLTALGYSYECSSQNIQRLKTFSQIWPKDACDPEKKAELMVKLSGVTGTKLPEMQEKTQLEAIIEYIAETAAQNHYKAPRKLWMPLLPSKLYLETLDEYRAWVPERKTGKIFELKAPIGLYDDPANQEQGTVWLDFAEGGHHAVCGGVVSGKSTFLQTAVFSLLNAYTPSQLQFYLLDFGSRMLTCFAQAPHVGGVVCEDDSDKIRMFFSLLERMMNERKELLKGGNYSQYVRANGSVIPAVLVVIDNYAGLKEKTQDQYAQMIWRLSREGVGYGMYLLICAAGFGMAEIPVKIGDNIKTVFSLEMGDKFKYGEVLRQPRIETLPEGGIKGRGLAWINGEVLEFQTALATEAEDDFERNRKLEEASGKMRRQWKKDVAVKIPEIPRDPEFSEFIKAPEVQKLYRDRRYIPIGYRESDAGIYAVDLRNTFCFLISGKSGSGKTNLIKALLLAAGKKEAGLVVIEQDGTELESVASSQKAEYIREHQEIFDYFKNLIPEFSARNERKRSCLAEGLEDDALYEKMQAVKPICVFIADMKAFTEAVYQKLPDGSDMDRFLENIMERGRMHNIYFFGCVRSEDEPTLLSRKMFKCFADCQAGIHLGGSLTAQRVFNFTNIPLTQQGRAVKPGRGLAPSGRDVCVAETIILPMVKGNGI